MPGAYMKLAGGLLNDSNALKELSLVLLGGSLFTERQPLAVKSQRLGIVSLVLVDFPQVVVKNEKKGLIFAAREGFHTSLEVVVSQRIVALRKGNSRDATQGLGQARRVSPA